jgi:hypothetical protein
MFLKALAFGLAIPAAARLARIATAAPTASSKRFLVYFMPHGIPPEHYNPRVMGGDPTNFDLDKTNVSILGPLQEYKSYVNVYQGFQYPGAADTHSGIVNCLSGTTVVDTTSPRTTVEHVIGKALGVKPLILGACSHQPYGLDNNGMLFWNGSAVDPEKNPAKVADTLFGSGGTTTPAPSANADVQLRSDLLALTASEIQGLSTELNGLTSEQTKLQKHLAAIQAMQSDGSGTGSGGPSSMSCSSKPSLPTVEKVRAASAGQVVDSSGGNDYFYQEKNFPLLLQAQLELIAQAMICNAAPVIGLMPMYTTCDFDFAFAGAAGSHHNTLSHTVPGMKGQYDSPISVDNYDATTRAGFAKAQLWFSQQLVKNVVSLLATTDDPTMPGTKVLDNTLIYCMSEIGDGANHLRDSRIEYPQVPQCLPLVTIGKAGGALKTGRVFAAPTDKDAAATKVNRPASDLYLTLAKAMGAPNVTFPNSTGAIMEVLA